MEKYKPPYPANTGLGGTVITHESTLAELQERVNNDPFVAEGVVTAEILEIEGNKADDRLSFLAG